MQVVLEVADILVPAALLEGVHFYVKRLAGDLGLEFKFLNLQPTLDDIAECDMSPVTTTMTWSCLMAAYKDPTSYEVAVPWYDTARFRTYMLYDWEDVDIYTGTPKQRALMSAIRSHELMPDQIDDIARLAKQHGFITYRDFLTHPDDWPLPTILLPPLWYNFF
jgi:hypothetical protein